MGKTTEKQDMDIRIGDHIIISAPFQDKEAAEKFRAAFIKKAKEECGF